MDKIAKLEEKISILEEKNKKNEEMISKLQEEFKSFKKNGLNGIEYSKILKSVEIDQIKNWIDPTNINEMDFKLLYRATEHGKSFKDFHSRCDNKGTTIAFISTDKGARFGGFTNLPWDMHNGSQENDPQAFIFSLDRNTKITCHDQSNVILCYWGIGLAFGGSDIGIQDNLGSGSYSKVTGSYGNNEGITDIHYLTGNTGDSYKFTPIEVEVYQVMKI